MGFVKLYLAAQLLKLGVRHIFKLKLIAEHAEGCNVKARWQRRIPERLLVRRGRNMRAHGRLRIQIRQAALDIEPLYRVGVVRCPYLRRIAQHAEIKAVAAG